MSTAVTDRPTADTAAPSLDRAEPLVLRSGGDSTSITIGSVFSLFGIVFAGIASNALVFGFEGPVMAPVVFGLTGVGALVVGLLLLFGRRRVDIDPDVRIVTRELRWLTLRSVVELPFDAYDSVGVATMRTGADGGHAGCVHYVLELRGPTDFALPGDWTGLDQALAQAGVVAQTMGLDVDQMPRNGLVGFLRWASGRCKA